MRRFWVHNRLEALGWLAALLLLTGALLVVFSLPLVLSAAGRHDPEPADAAAEWDAEALPAMAALTVAQQEIAEPQATPSASQTAVDPNGVAATPVNMFAPVPGAPEQADTSPPIEPEEVPSLDDILIEVVRRTPHPTGPMRVLIYHTHTWEAYEPTEQATYQATQQWRTKDSEHNVARVGEELAKELRGLGMEVVHDATDLEPPDLSTAYTRSLALLEEYRAKGETFDFYIDLHRDAYNKSMKNTNTVTVHGVEMARISVLIGKGTGQTEAGFDQKPNWEVNILLAQRITDALNAQVDGLARPVITKTGRFNQHVSESAVLIEVGNNMNTLEQALAAMPYLARAIERSAPR